MKTISKQMMAALAAVWFLVLLVVWWNWFAFGADPRPAAKAIVASVIADATVVAVSLSTLFVVLASPATSRRLTSSHDHSAWDSEESENWERAPQREYEEAVHS
jgi:hypothetical protein